MDKGNVQLEYPADLLTELSEEQIWQLAREAFYARLYEQGHISSGKAGALLGVTRSDFLDVLGAFGISVFDPNTDLAEDLRHAHAAS